MLQGTIERVTYHNPETGYAVLRVKVNQQRDLVTVVGHITSATPGEYIESEGEWIQHRDFGLQFKANLLKTVHPATLEGIEKYLGSGMVKGIGPHFAKKLVSAFKTEIFDIIEKTPERLKQIPGIGPVRIKKITSAWQDQKVIREIMVFLQSHGVSTTRSVKIYKTYGANAIEKVKENPYQLARDIHGIGFISADQIASHLGIAKNSLIRAQAGIHYVLQKTTNDGHCAYPKEDLIKESEKLLEIEKSIIEDALTLEATEGHLVYDEILGKSCFYVSSLYQCEMEAARLLASLAKAKLPWDKLDADKAISWVESQTGIKLASLQVEAVKTSLSSKVFIITGGPGTGKTTITKSIISILKAKGMRIALGSPTGRAAKRLSECTGLEAKTIHRLLGFDPKKGGFLYDRSNPLPIDFLLVDEASMIDITLMYHLLKAIPEHAALVFVGDIDQIPSVGPGQVLKSLIDSQQIPTVGLTQIFRQSEGSEIVKTAHLIKDGRLPNLDRKDRESDFHFIASEEPQATLSKILDMVKNRIPKAFGFDPIKDIQVLCPMNRGALGCRSLNLELQKLLNPYPSVKVERFGSVYAPGDKVMVISNHYEKGVFNGDIGIIQDIDLTEQETLIGFDGNLVTFDFSEMDILTLAYSISIHKSQGSEYPAVIIPLAMQHYMMLKRNLIYTGITRGKKLTIIVGEKKALAIGVKTNRQEVRWNKLSDRLKLAFTP